MSDRQHISRIRHAMQKLLMARNYSQQAERLVKEAEKELQSAIAAVNRPEPDGDGERKAA